jgi:hypothetical protein
VITGAAFLPHPPLLVPEVAQGASHELDALRTACRVAITRVAAPDRRLLVIGSGPRSAFFDASARGSLAPYGVALEVGLGRDEPGPADLPLALTIAAWLLRDALGPDCGAAGYSIGPSGGDVAQLRRWVGDGAVALLVMGDGSARRSTSAPGYYDERAEAFDAGVADALRSGDGQRLSVDVGLGAQLLASGPPIWEVAGTLLGGAPFDAELVYAGAPCGVGYFVAAWTARA